MKYLILSVAGIVILSSAVSAAPQKYAKPVAYEAGPAKYDYAYAVKDDYSGNNYGQNESRDGYATSGSYYVALPDGRVQKVVYTVNGDSGYVADVSYTGEAKY
eukprot:07057.XXX_294525_294986_1 [CDS] Oithona nana genome sequencing.